MFTKLIKFLKKNYLYILAVIMMIVVVQMIIGRERFQIIDLVVPPLEKIS